MGIDPVLWDARLTQKGPCQNAKREVNAVVVVMLG
jgi:hypothetical protein